MKSKDKMNINQIYYQATDTAKLTGIIYKTNQPTTKILISTHGMSTNCLKKRDETIAHKLNENHIDYLTYNNRGHDIVNYTYKETGEKILAGTAYEDVEDSYFDILGTIKYALKLGYEEIYLQGHSLGATKTLYTYNKLLKEPENEEIAKHIKAIILLSLVDIPTATRIYLNDKYPQMLTYAKNLEREKMGTTLMPEGTFIYPISVRTFLKYARDYQNFDFARYSDTIYTYPELNNIEIPLFMRWGNDKELILQKAEELCDMLNKKINKPNLNIGYIDKADHSYTGKEEILAKEIQEFLNKENN